MGVYKPGHPGYEDIFRKEYRPFNTHELEFKNAIKVKAEELLFIIEEAQTHNRVSPHPEALDKARDKLREVVWWAVYSISE